MIAVMGASGNTGKVAAARLLQSGEKVRAIGRDAARLAPLAAKGAEVAVADANDVGALTRAFSGADAAYTLLPPDMTATDYRKQQDHVGESTVRALREAGIRRVVLLSSLGAELPSGTGPIAGLHAQEERLKTLPGADVLTLRAGYFFENHFATLGLIKQQGINGGAFAGDLPISMIATRDIGEAVAQLLHARDFKGFTVRELLGERDLTMNEVTRIVGAKIGKPDLKYVQFPYDAFTASLAQMGIPGALADQYAEMVRAINERRIRSLEGRSPESSTSTKFEQFADALAQAYKAM